jgi:hypothetical protein
MVLDALKKRLDDAANSKEAVEHYDEGVSEDSR